MSELFFCGLFWSVVVSLQKKKKNGEKCIIARKVKSLVWAFNIFFFFFHDDKKTKKTKKK